MSLDPISLPGVNLDLPIPPQLEKAVEYEGTARFVALYWLPGGDEVMVTDGSAGGTGNPYGYIAFINHPLIAKRLGDYRYALGSSDEEATHWLVIDRETRQASVTLVREAAQFLAAQWPTAPTALPVRLTEAEWGEVVQQLREKLASCPSEAEIVAAMRAHHQLVEAMVAWLHAAERVATQRN